jgi:uncharacterized membrane protein YfcA
VADIVDTLLFIILILLMGSFTQGVSGFGLGLISMSFLPIFLPLKDSTLLVLVSTAVISLKIVYKYRSSIRWRAIMYILIFAIVGRICSFFVLNEFGNLLIMKKFLGVLLIGFVFFLFKKDAINPDSRNIQRNTFTAFIGFLGGLIGGVFAVGGPVFVIYLLIRFTEKIEYNVNLQTVFFLTNLFTIILHLLNGDFHHELGVYVLMAILPVLLGVQLGLHWFEKLPNHLIKKIASYIVLLAGLNLIFFT